MHLNIFIISVIYTQFFIIFVSCDQGKHVCAHPALFLSAFPALGHHGRYFCLNGPSSPQATHPCQGEMAWIAPSACHAFAFGPPDTWTWLEHVPMETSRDDSNQTVLNAPSWYRGQVAWLLASLGCVSSVPHLHEVDELIMIFRSLPQVSVCWGFWDWWYYVKQQVKSL